MQETIQESSNKKDSIDKIVQVDEKQNNKKTFGFGETTWKNKEEEKRKIPPEPLKEENPKDMFRLTGLIR